MSAALAIAARDDLRRLAREQDAAASDFRERACDVAVLATSRGEAARAVMLLGERENVPALHRVAAVMQFRTLTGREPIPSATLTAWADGWDSYAATLTTGCAS